MRSNNFDTKTVAKLTMPMKLLWVIFEGSYFSASLKKTYIFHKIIIYLYLYINQGKPFLHLSMQDCTDLYYIEKKQVRALTFVDQNSRGYFDPWLISFIFSFVK